VTGGWRQRCRGSGPGRCRTPRAGTEGGVGDDRRTGGDARRKRLPVIDSGQHDGEREMVTAWKERRL
jgi:hypothetical protein